VYQALLNLRQPGQTSSEEVKRRDLRAELLAAEQEARERKRRADGTFVADSESTGLVIAVEDGDAEESSKRRKLLQEAIRTERSEEDDDDDDERSKNDDEDENDDDDDDDEDETAELLRELDKIKRERAEEKQRQEREANTKTEEERAAEIAMGNPLLNLAAALGQTPKTANVGGTFAVKKRWDDDLVFKNQAQSAPQQPTHFVNDLLRTEFHKKFMAKFIK